MDMFHECARTVASKLLWLIKGKSIYIQALRGCKQRLLQFVSEGKEINFYYKQWSEWTELPVMFKLRILFNIVH